MNKILILGAGNIGSRHLQSMAKSSLSLEITVVDPSDRALDLSKRRFDEIAKQGNIEEPKYFKSLDHVGLHFDIGIVATTSDVRRQVIEDLLQKTNVKYLILEKVAFPSPSDFENAIKMLKSRRVKAWVNFPRRAMPFYNDLKKMFKPHEQVFYSVQGGEWGLACNAIHFLDSLCFLIEETDYDVSCSNLDGAVLESRRKGFVEFTGALHCHFRNGSELSLFSQKGSNQPPLATIMNKSMMYLIEDEKGLARVSKEEQRWEWEQTRFKWYNQSELTYKLIEEIVDTGNCGLTAIEESYLIHKPLLESFMDHLEKLTGKKYSSCPIT